MPTLIISMHIQNDIIFHKHVPGVAVYYCTYNQRASSIPIFLCCNDIKCISFAELYSYTEEPEFLLNQQCYDESVTGHCESSTRYTETRVINNRKKYK